MGVHRRPTKKLTPVPRMYPLSHGPITNSEKVRGVVFYCPSSFDPHALPRPEHLVSSPPVLVVRWEALSCPDGVPPLVYPWVMLWFLLLLTSKSVCRNFFVKGVCVFVEIFTA